MKTYQNVRPQYVAPIDLQTLNTAYANLESMHQQAVQTSSELKNAIAQLQLNESEEPFRQQLVKSVEDTISQNMYHDNLAGAYDDIVKLSGDIVSNPALIGRLKAQQEYLNYQAKVDAMALPDDYKQYFKEKNPYHYTDTYDSSGRIIGGTKWTPVKTPTTMVNLSDIVDKGIKRAAEEIGQSSITRWLDKDGNITTDPSKAFDGEVYDVTTSNWRKLGADKIRDSIYAVIEETPGAKESLDQDYEIALWKHNKYPTSGELTVSDITDENGNILSSEMYLAKRINDAAKTAAYNYRTSNTTYGDGLSTYIKATRTPQTGAGAGIDQNTYNILDSAFRDEPVTFTYNKGKNAYETKTNTIHQVREVLKSFGISTDSADIESLSNAINQIPETVNGQSTAQTKDMLNYQLLLLEEADYNLSTIKESMTPKERDRYEFALGMNEGGKAVKDRTKFDNQVISINNRIFENGKTLSINFNSKTDLDEFLTLFPNNTNYNELGIEIKNNSILIDSVNRNVLPMLSSKVLEYNKRNSGFFTKLFGKDKYDIRLFNDKGEDVTSFVYGNQSGTVNETANNFINLGGLYGKAQSFLHKYDDKYDISQKDITVSNIDIHGETYTDNYTSQMYNLGLMEMVDKKRIDDSVDADIDNSLLNFDTTQYDVYTKDGQITDGKTLQELKHEFRVALNEGRLSKTSSLVPGIVDGHSGLQGGYTVTILPPKNNKGKEIGETKQYYIPGLGQEAHLQTLNQNPTFNASNTLDVLNETLSTKYLTTTRTNPSLGHISLTALGNRNYSCNFNGYEFVLDKKEATELITTLGDYRIIKNYIKTRNLSLEDFVKSNERAANSMNMIISNISKLTGYQEELIADVLINDIEQ